MKLVGVVTGATLVLLQQLSAEINLNDGGTVPRWNYASVADVNTALDSAGITKDRERSKYIKNYNKHVRSLAIKAKKAERVGEKEVEHQEKAEDASEAKDNFAEQQAEKIQNSQERFQEFTADNAEKIQEAQDKLEAQAENKVIKDQDRANKVEQVAEKNAELSEAFAEKDLMVDDKNAAVARNEAANHAAHVDKTRKLDAKHADQEELRQELYARAAAKKAAQDASKAEKQADHQAKAQDHADNIAEKAQNRVDKTALIAAKEAKKQAKLAEKTRWSLAKSREKLAKKLSKMSTEDGDILADTGCMGNQIEWFHNTPPTYDGTTEVESAGFLNVTFPDECLGLWYTIIDTKGEIVEIHLDDDGSEHVNSISHKSGQKGYRILTDNDHWGLGLGHEQIQMTIDSINDPSTHFKYYYCCQGPDELRYTQASHCLGASNDYAAYSENSTVANKFIVNNRKRKRRKRDDHEYTFGTVGLNHNAFDSSASAQYFIVQGSPFLPITNMWVKYDEGDLTKDVSVTKVGTDTFQVEAHDIDHYYVKFEGVANGGHFVSWHWCQTW